MSQGGRGSDIVQPSTLLLHTDAAELVVVGEIASRDIVAARAPFDDEGGLEVDGPSVIDCLARYEVDVSDVLKNSTGTEDTDQVLALSLELQAYPADNATDLLRDPLSLRDQVVLFLSKAGETEYFYVVGRRFVVADGMVHTGDVYDDAPDRMPLGAFRDQILERASEVEEERPIEEIIEEEEEAP